MHQVSPRVLNQLRRAQSQHTDIEILTKEFIDHCEYSQKLSKWTIRTRASHLKILVDFSTQVGLTDIGDFSLVVLDTYFSYFGDTHSESTLNTDKRIMKSFFQWLGEYKEFQVRVQPENIRTHKDKPQRPKAIKHDIILSVISQLNVTDRLIISVIYEAGLRISEVVNLQPEDINGTTLFIKGKGSYERTVYISEKLAEQLRENTSKQGIFGSERLTTHTVRNHIQSAFLKYAGMWVKPHQLRHSFAIRLLENGCDIVTIQRLLGHADITTTQRYLLIKDRYIYDQYEKYAPKTRRVS